MSPMPPPQLVALSERARSGLSTLKRKMVPPGIALLDFIGDLWGFHIAFALAELSVCDAIRDAGPEPAAADQIAEQLSVNSDMLYRTLRAASQLGLVTEHSNKRFSLTSLGQAMCKSPEASFVDFIIFMGRHGTQNWPLLADCIRTGKTAVELRHGKQPFDWLTGNPEVMESFNRAMTAVSNVACEAVVAAHDFTQYQHITDVGGGHGRLLGALLKSAPKARGTLLDLPQVVAGAPELLEGLGVRSRVEAVGGSFFEAVPAGADLYVSKSVIHDWQDEQATQILKCIRKAMGTKQARLMLCETVVPGPGKPHFAKLLDLEMVVHGGGRERTEDEYAALLRGANFRLDAIEATAGPMSLVLGSPA
ncbi:MAG: hydroxyneurosporene methyltransferase [Polyangiaceae bacterium]|nr:hydroxyneurosporene methyltransferase [Polyangiaceae bacterium]MCB9605652.1 hydroxyneurosporene methyltransferase [Polyangiaceae bacterium]